MLDKLNFVRSQSKPPLFTILSILSLILYCRKDEVTNPIQEDKLSYSHRKIFEKYDINKSPTDDIAREHSQSDSSDHEDINNPVPMDIGMTSYSCINYSRLRLIGSTYHRITERNYSLDCIISVIGSKHTRSQSAPNNRSLLYIIISLS